MLQYNSLITLICHRSVQNNNNNNNNIYLKSNIHRSSIDYKCKITKISLSLILFLCSRDQFFNVYICLFQTRGPYKNKLNYNNIKL